MSDLYAIISNKYLKCSVITTSQASALHLQKFSSCFVGVSRPLLQDFWHQMVDTRATLFQYSFRTRVRQFSFIFFFFSIFFNAVNTIPLRPATHPRANEDEVAFDLREPSYTGNSMLSTLVSPSLPLEGRCGGRRWNPQSSLPAIKDRSSNIESHPIGHRGSRRHP